MASHNALGEKGEKLAVDFLLKKGFEILETNYRFQKHEIDIVAKKKGIIAIVEVKTRSTAFFGDPQSFVKPKQIQSLVLAADHYVTLNQLDVEVRFDVITVLTAKKGFEVKHYEDAFYHF